MDFSQIILGFFSCGKKIKMVYMVTSFKVLLMWTDNTSPPLLAGGAHLSCLVEQVHAHQKMVSQLTDYKQGEET